MPLRLFTNGFCATYPCSAHCFSQQLDMADRDFWAHALTWQVVDWCTLRGVCSSVLMFWLMLSVLLYSAYNWTLLRCRNAFGMLSSRRYLTLLGYLLYYHAKLAHTVTSTADRYIICSSMGYSSPCWSILNDAPCLIWLRTLCWSMLHAKLCLCCAILYAFLYCSVLYKAPCDMLFHSRCCSMLDAVTCLILPCAFMFPYVVGIMLLHAYATPCFILLHPICCTMLDAVPFSTNQCLAGHYFTAPILLP